MTSWINLDKPISIKCSICQTDICDKCMLICPKCNPKWISVKEQLPPEKVFRSIYLVTTYSHLKNKKFVEPLHYIGGEWFEMIHEEPLDTSEYEITHWMPLPDAPEKEQC